MNMLPVVSYWNRHCSVVQESRVVPSRPSFHIFQDILDTWCITVGIS